MDAGVSVSGLDGPYGVLLSVLPRRVTHSVMRGVISKIPGLLDGYLSLIRFAVSGERPFVCLEVIFFL